MTGWTVHDEQRRREEHLTACWAGCDDLHDDGCEDCELPDCVGDCFDGRPAGPPRVVTEYGFEERGLL